MGQGGGGGCNCSCGVRGVAQFSEGNEQPEKQPTCFLPNRVEQTNCGHGVHLGEYASRILSKCETSSQANSFKIRTMIFCDWRTRQFQGPHENSKFSPPPSSFRRFDPPYPEFQMWRSKLLGGVSDIGHVAQVTSGNWPHREHPELFLLRHPR